MCGISGYYSLSNRTGTRDILVMNRMIDHRGPDDEGYTFIDNGSAVITHLAGEKSHPIIKSRLPLIEEQSAISHNIAMGHARYAIVDLTEAGHQPFVQHGVTVSFNGELYNYIEIKEELLAIGHHFTTNNDTEVLLKAYLQYGTGCFEKFNGPFAVAIYDERSQTLLLARDKIGKAPLYYTVQNNTLYWSSEIKPLLEMNPGLRTNVNEKAVYNFVHFGIRDFANETFWNTIQTLPAASYACFKNTLVVEPHFYWQIPEKRYGSHEISINEAVATFKEIFQKAIYMRLRCDLPIGFTLSGGLDSSAIMAFYCKMYDKPVSAYSLEFEEKEANEIMYARSVANHFPGKINLNVIQGLDSDLMNELDYFVHLEEEPFLSPNLYTDFHLQCLLKKEGIGVNINGAGGDELLAGYEFEYLPPHLNYLMRNNKKAYFSQLSDLLVNNKYKIRTKGRLLLESIGLKAQITETKQNYLKVECGYDMAFSRDFNQLMVNNFKDYKMNYWLRSSAKTFYGIPIEARNPLLDADLVEYCFKLPPEYLINKGWHKYILRKAVEDILPKEIVWRKNKMGFPFMLNTWLAKNKPILETLLRTSQSPLVHTSLLANDYDKLLNIDPSLLWRLISLEMWYRKLVLKEQLV